MADGDGQIVIPGDRAWLAGADGEVVVLRDAELRANRDLDAAIDGGAGKILRGGLGFAAGGESQGQQNREKAKMGQVEFL
jgi:hypothetical protein